jgi:hypothetical protein
LIFSISLEAEPVLPEMYNCEIFFNFGSFAVEFTKRVVEFECPRL